MKRALLAGTILWLAAYGVYAVDIGGDELGITLDFTYASKYIWHGYDVYDGRGAFQPGLNLDFKGFYGGIFGSWADSSRFTDQSEVDFYLGYEFTFFKDDWYAIYNYITYKYYSHPSMGDRNDLQELANGLSFPKLIPIGPSFLVPYYDTYYIWAGFQGERWIDNGNVHDFGFAYDLPVPSLLAEQENQKIRFNWGITFNDGTLTSNSEWSHTTFGVSTTFEWNNFYLTPSLHYQWSLDNAFNAVNRDDEFYASVGMGYRF
jgi:hypothetical protein